MVQMRFFRSCTVSTMIEQKTLTGKTHQECMLQTNLSLWGKCIKVQQMSACDSTHSCEQAPQKWMRFHMLCVLAQLKTHQNMHRCERYERHTQLTYRSYHVISRKQLLEEFSLFMQHCLDNKFIITGDIKKRPTCPRVRKLNKRFITQRILVWEKRNSRICNNTASTNLASHQ